MCVVPELSFLDEGRWVGRATLVSVRKFCRSDLSSASFSCGKGFADVQRSKGKLLVNGCFLFKTL